MVLLLQKVVSRVAVPADLMVVGAMVLSAIVGVLVYRAVEAPLLRIGQQLVRDLVGKKRSTAAQAARPTLTGESDRRRAVPGHQQR